MANSPTDPADEAQKKAKPDPKSLTFRLLPVAKMLTTTDAQWANAQPQETQPVPISMRPPQVRPDYRDPLELARLRYRTAHLVLYYFIQIEGELGVAKIRKFLDVNRDYLAQFKEYEEQYKQYQIALEQFKRLPGVKDLPGGRIEYPSNLKLPQAPAAPFTDPNLVKLGGIKALLGNDSPEVVGRRIESALGENLGLKLQFSD